MTGNYPWRGRLENGTWMFHQRSQILDGQTTLGQLMQNAGYRTAFLGKVHLGGTVFSATTNKPVSWKYDYRDIDFSRKWKDGPSDLGFDFSYSLPQGIQGPPYIAFRNGMLDGAILTTLLNGNLARMEFCDPDKRFWFETVGLIHSRPRSYS